MIKKLIEQLEACCYALEYAAYNYDGAKLENLMPGLLDSTGVSDTCLIAVRDSKKLIEQIRSSINLYESNEFRTVGNNENTQEKCSCINSRQVAKINGVFICSQCNKPI